ncbi:MAG: HEAT repeat domain-containing protein [Armatimonadota bacterium]|jgi:hypothetical protein
MNTLVVLAGLFLLAHKPSPQAPAKPAAPPGHGAIVSRGGVTPVSLPESVNSSEFVWKGEITAATEQHTIDLPYGGSTVTAGVQGLTFRVDRAIKGAAPRSGVADFDLYVPVGRGPLWGRIGGPFAPGWYGVVFLSIQDSRLAPTDPVYVGVQTSPVPAPDLATRDPMANVEGELINTLGDEQHARVQSAVDLLVALHDQVAVASLSGSPEGVVPLDRDRLLAALHVLAERSAPVLSGTALAALLRLGDLSRLDDAISFVERYGPPPGESTEPSYQGTDNTGYVRGQILNAISRLDDDAAAPLLNPLLQSPDSWVRRNVADALRRACHASSMPYFAAALDDPDAGVAMAAIYGLLDCYQRLNWSAQQWTQYRGTGGGADRVPERDSGMLPNTDEFQKHPDLYRRFWKDWWETKGRGAYAAWERSHAAEATP